MSWTVEYDVELGVVQCTYVGQVTADEFAEATIKAIALAKDNNTNLFLICDDCYIDKITSRKGHKTYYTNDPFAYIRRLKGNEPIHPQKFH